MKLFTTNTTTKVVNSIGSLFGAKLDRRGIDIETEIMNAVTIDYNKLSPKEIKKAVRAAFCTDHTAKMHGVWSISTSCLLNLRCLARMRNGASICAHCFSASMNGQYDALRVKLMRNTVLLNTVELTPDMIPHIGCKSKMFRFESFGDLVSPLQVKNYFMIAACNPHVKAALWTKNPDVIAKAIEKYGLVKPANLNIILSTLELDADPAPVEYDFIDKVFTVYSTEEVAASKGVTINCGARSCATCQRCYTKTEGVEQVAELLK